MEAGWDEDAAIHYYNVIEEVKRGGLREREEEDE